jgi:TonB-linked SusC/RagA family outer membrane protein
MKRKVYLALLACLCSAFAWSQTRQVTGRVVSDSSQSLSGVNVSVKGTTTTVSTNQNGQYTINIPNRDNVVLTFSSVGYTTQDVPVGNRSVVDVTLAIASSSLNDVVVIGYQTVRRRDVSGTVSSIQAKDLEKIPVSSAAEALTGRLPGVQVMTTDGAPGADIVIRVRGGGSITQDNSPLYIVDGFPVSNINDISPSDIASIDILKDAATAAIYGARGANGVVIVTTKSAKAGKTTVSYNGWGQARTLPRELEVLSPYQYVLAQYEYAKLRNDTSNFTKYFGVYDDIELYKNQQGTNWQDKLFGSTKISQQHDLSITGGTAKTKIGLTVTNNKDQGLQPGSGYMRNYLNLKLNHQISDALKFDFASRFTHTVVDGAGTSGSASVRVGDAITTRPVNGIADQIVFDPNAATSDDQYEQFLKSVIDPLTLTAQDYRKRVNKVLNLNAAVSWSATDNLSFRSEFGTDFNFGRTKRFWGPLTNEASKNSGLPLGDLTLSESRGLRWTNTASYRLIRGDQHDFNFLAGQEILSSGAGNTDFTRSIKFSLNTQPDALFANMQNGITDQHRTSVNASTKTASYFGRVIYQFDRKYIINLTGRFDGSTNFAPGKQWGFFPAASFAWRVSDEDFMQDVSFVSDLKFRFSYGAAGNDRIGRNQWRSVWNLATNRPIGFDDVQQPYYVPNGNLPNPDIKWETTITRNLGLDFGLFKNRLNGTLDVYWNTTKDLLLASAIPQTTGYTTQFQNVGQTSNKGVDLGLNATLVSKKDFELTANFNIGINKARIDKLNGVEENQINSNWASTDLKTQDDYRLRVGQTIGLMYGYETDGWYTSDDFSSYNPTTRTYTLKPGVPNVGAFMGGISLRPGVLKLKDLDSSGVIDAKDRTVIGHALPKHSGGFGINGRFKNFDFLAFFNWMYGNQVYNTGKISFNMYYRTTWGNMLNTMNYDNRYHYIDGNGNMVTDLTELAKLNANAKVWSPFSMGNASPVFHSWAVEDGSFLRLQNISLGYSLPQKMISKLYMTRLRVYFTVYNAFLWTSYSGYDPEVSSTRSDGYSQLVPGVDYSAYPKSRNYTAGINVTF